MAPRPPTFGTPRPSGGAAVLDTYRGIGLVVEDDAGRGLNLALGAALGAWRHLVSGTAVGD